MNPSLCEALGEAMYTPGLIFEPSFGARVLALRLALGAAQRSLEGAGRAHAPGHGTDLVGFRPYCPGEDVRELDWNLLARLDKPYVRVTRREAGERWVLALDGSASMGVGPPSKWQRAAECGVALWALAGLAHAQVRILVSGGERGAPRVLESNAPAGLEAPLAFFGPLRAQGAEGLAHLLSLGRLLRGATRVFCIGDFGEQALRPLFDLRRRVRDLHVLQLLAPLEFEPPLGSVELVDPESGQSLRREVDESLRREYQTQLEASLENWRQLAKKHRFQFDARSSAVPFEELCRCLTRSM